MSVRKGQYMSLAGLNLAKAGKNDLRTRFHDVLDAGMHGLCFSAYEEGQKPGDTLTREQIERRLEIMRPHTEWVRTFSCTEGNELITKIAKEKGFKTLVGAWLGKDEEMNEKEIAAAIKLTKEGAVDVLAVGNEVLYRGDLTVEELLTYISRVKEEVSVPVGYVDAYYEFRDRPEVSDACDVILTNCYPFWEGCAVEYSLPYMKDMYAVAKRAAKGKPVIITETGWPNKGTTFYGAIPSEENALKYFIDAQDWAKEEDIDMFYFSSFDEEWKTGTEGDVGAYWGLWDKTEKLKW